MTDQKIETLSFSIGGFHAGWEQIIWHENKFQHQFYQHIYPEHIKIPPDKIYSETVPREKDWEIFWKEVDKLKVWSWKKDYLNDPLYGMCWIHNTEEKKHMEFLKNNEINNAIDKYVKYEQRIQFRQKINKKLPFIKNIKLSFWKK